jgi:hypothetical protein
VFGVFVVVVVVVRDKESRLRSVPSSYFWGEFVRIGDSSFLISIYQLYKRISLWYFHISYMHIFWSKSSPLLLFLISTLSPF